MSEHLEDIAIAMVAEGQGILAADESTGTIKKRFDSIRAESTETSRRDYREMLFRADEAMKNHVCGVILFEETLGWWILSRQPVRFPASRSTKVPNRWPIPPLKR